MDDATATTLQQRLESLLETWPVPGISIAIDDGSGVREIVSGVTSVDTKVEVTPDTLFQIGSITKVFTATLVMQLVEAGRIALDDPIARYVPAFESRMDKLTIRQLLTHTSGLDGDYFAGFGFGDDAIARYAEVSAALPQVFAPGAYYGYCNAGFVVLGRMIELLRGQRYEDALRERVLEPLGLNHLTARPEDALLSRVSVGHRVSFEDPVPKVASNWPMNGRASVPAGAMVSGTATELVRFGRAHLEGGAGIIDKASALAMREPHAPKPSPVADRRTIGLAWHCNEWNGVHAFEHSGGTVGQISLLVVFPDHDTVLAILTNSLAGGIVMNRFMRDFYEHVLQVDPPPTPQLPDPPLDIDLNRYTGVYGDVRTRLTVTAADGALVLKRQETNEELNVLPEMRYTALGDDWFNEPVGVFGPTRFFGGADGAPPPYVFTNERVLRRVDWL